MYVKYWPIKQDLKDVLEYIMDISKTTMGENEFSVLHSTDNRDLKEEIQMDVEENIKQVFDYINNTDKIKGRYISGYCCTPDTALQTFLLDQEESWKMKGGKKNKGPVAYHLVQSFPYDLDISDEEVHQCGLELCEKMKKYQAVVCSHVHPVTDEDGIVHGKCKHNHILFNAYIMPDQIDPEHPKIFKFHDCNEMYDQMQMWNDEIAIEHGLPIIRDADTEKTYSWFESNEENRKRSWKRHMMSDLEEARRFSKGWDSFTQCLIQNGYKINGKKNITYIAPDGQHRAREKTLGRRYTRQELELFWATKAQTEDAVKENLEITDKPSFSEIVTSIGEGDFLAAVPIGKKGSETFKLLPITYMKGKDEALASYFNADAMYDIYDPTGKYIVTAASGNDIRNFMSDPESADARNKRAAQKEKRKQKEEEEFIKRTNVEKEKDHKKQYYYNPAFINSKTGKPYQTLLYDKHGNQRSMIELIYLLAATVLNFDEEALNENRRTGEAEISVMNVQRDWRLQEQFDAIRIAREEDLHTPTEIEEALNAKGAEYSRIRAGLNRKKNTKTKMDSLADAIAKFETSKRLAEAIYALPEGAEKEKLKGRNNEILKKYNDALAVLHAFRVSSQAEIDDFKRRYSDVCQNIVEQEKQYEPAKEEYRRLKKLQYAAKKAQTPDYVFGKPEKDLETSEQREEEMQAYWRKTRPNGPIIPQSRELEKEEIFTSEKAPENRQQTDKKI